MRTRCAFALLIFALSLAGCLSLDSGSWGGGGSGLSSHTRDRSFLSDVVHITRNDRIELLLLIEGTGSGSVHGGNPPSGTILGPDGRVVNWSCTTRYGKLREFQIDSATFPLTSGGVFYIDVRDARTMVRQLDLDPNEVAGGKGSIRQNVRAFAGNNPIIADFCARCNPPE